MRERDCDLMFHLHTKTQRKISIFNENYERRDRKDIEKRYKRDGEEIEKRWRRGRKEIEKPQRRNRKEFPKRFNFLFFSKISIQSFLNSKL